MGQNQSYVLAPLEGHPNQHYGSTPDELAAVASRDYLTVMTNGMNAHPRSHQKMIGPSEIGIPCSRRLLYKLAQVAEPLRGPAWKPAVGTALHSQQEDWFGNPAVTGQDGRFLLEERVMVGYIGIEEVWGSTDLYDQYTGGVVDHKFVGPSRLKLYRTKGPSQEYRAQAHLYGRGWALAGYNVRYVMIAFVPRDGELSQTHFWHEPYRPDIADWALARANTLYAQLTNLGLEAALALYPACGDAYCPWCQQERSAARLQELTAHPFQ